MNINIKSVRKPGNKHREYFGESYIVRGLGKRAIIVNIGIFGAIAEWIDIETIISEAATYALRKGYKRVFVMQDHIVTTWGAFHNTWQSHGRWGNTYDQLTDGMSVGTSTYDRKEDKYDESFYSLSRSQCLF